MSSFEIGTVELEEEKGKNQRGFKVPDVYSFIQQSLFRSTSGQALALGATRNTKVTKTWKLLLHDRDERS